MALIRLKNIIKKGKNTRHLLEELAQELNSSLVVEDTNGYTLFSIGEHPGGKKWPLHIAGEDFGAIYSSNHGSIYTSFLNQAIQSEIERKKLGREVLDLYREINTIYQFGEKLADIIIPQKVAELTLKEAQKLIESQSGIVVMNNGENGELQVMARDGQLFDSISHEKAKIVITEIIAGGQAKIIQGNKELLAMINPHIEVLMYAPFKVGERSFGTVMLANHDRITYQAADLKLLTTLALQSASAIESARLFEKGLREAEEREAAMREVHEITTRFVPMEFIKSLGHKALLDVSLGDQVERDVTVVFVDIRSYTSLAEQMTPEENFSFVNAFNGRLGPIVRKYGGFINQYLGDGFIAIFPDRADLALEAAIQMQKAIEQYNMDRKKQGRDAIRIGIGMHTGPLIMGITGDQDRLDAAIISDTVNTAARIESLTKYYHCRILLTGKTFADLSNPNQYSFRNLGQVQVKGKSEPLSLYECFNGDPGDQFIHKKSTLVDFEKGLEAYLHREFDHAIHSFNKVLKMHAVDETAQVLIHKAQKLANSLLPPDWNGVEKMIIK